MLGFLFVKPLVPFAKQIELLALDIPFFPQEEEEIEIKSKTTRLAPDIAGEMIVLALQTVLFSVENFKSMRVIYEAG